VIVDCAVYEGGHRLPGVVELDHALETGRAADDRFVWIGLHEPTADEFEAVAKEFGLHPLAVEDAIKAHQRPKLELYDDNLFLVLKSAGFEPDGELVELSQIMIFLGEGYIVTVRHGSSGELGRVRHALEHNARHLTWGTTSVLYAVTDRVVDDHTGVARQLEPVIDDIEQEVFSGARPGQAARIFRLRREVLDFKRAVGPLIEPVGRLARGEIRCIHEDATEYFRDVHDHLLRVNDQIDKFDTLLSSAMEAHVAQVGLRQNEDMRRISAWVAILAVPTMIAGIYGMNFDNMPELRQESGYFFVLGLMVVCCSVLYLLFRRRGWLGPDEIALNPPGAGASARSAGSGPPAHHAG
jgi:magnesium transporter